MMKQIWVIGGANVDIMAASFKPLIARDSNPGTVSCSIGGVAHNVACNLAKMGCPVHFITALSDDVFASMVERECLDSGIMMEHSQHISGYSTSMYLAIAQPDGDMAIAIADMDILSHLDVEAILPLLRNMNEDDLVFIDTNLTETQIRDIVTNCRGRIFCDPISTPKAGKILPYLQNIEALKPNLLEAQSMLESDTEDPLELLKGFKKKGLDTVVISMGADGIIGYDRDGACHVSSLKTEVINTTGAGDACMAGFMYGQYQDRSFTDSVRLAVAAGTIAVNSLKTVSDDMNEDRLNEYCEKVDCHSMVDILKIDEEVI